MRRTVETSVIFLIWLGCMASGGINKQDQAIVSLFQKSEPDLKYFTVILRHRVSEQESVVLALGTTYPVDNSPTQHFPWTSKDRLGLFLQKGAVSGQTYQLASEPGSSDNCSMKIERFTAQELVLACMKEKEAISENHKLVYDLPSNKLLSHFSYSSFGVFQILEDPTALKFVMSNPQKLLLVGLDPGTESFMIIPEEKARITLARIPMTESEVPGEGPIRTPQPPPDLTPPFGPGHRFSLSQETDKTWPSSWVVVEKLKGIVKSYPMPKSEVKDWELARKDEATLRSIPPTKAELKEQIGPHQLKGDRLWFGKTFYNGEGDTGVGGFGYFDPLRRAYHLYSPPEIHAWSVGAILVESEFLWLALQHFGEYGTSPGGLLRWDRKTEQVRMFRIDSVISQIRRYNGVLYLGANDGIIVLRDDRLQSFFVDQVNGNQYRIVARERTIH
ncbi:MAG: hypothetical protein U0V70_17450 [Terriglobia bacterium]